MRGYIQCWHDFTIPSRLYAFGLFVCGKAHVTHFAQGSSECSVQNENENSII